MKDTNNNDWDDLRSLVTNALNDIGAIFEVLTERLAEDATGRSMCTTGSYLCDSWRDMILAELARQSPSGGDRVYSDDVLAHLEKLRQEGSTAPRMLTPTEIELSRQHLKQTSARARANFKAMGVKPVRR